jgi:hypothetical protein
VLFSDQIPDKQSNSCGEPDDGENSQKRLLIANDPGKLEILLQAFRYSL